MKTLTIAFASFSTFAVLATPPKSDFIKKCIETSRSKGVSMVHTIILCNGASTQKEVDLLQKCFDNGPKNEDHGAILCSGLKTTDAFDAVGLCYHTFLENEAGQEDDSYNEHIATILCSGVRTKKQSTEIQNCYKNMLIDYQPEISALSCAGDVRAAYLVDGIIQFKTPKVEVQPESEPVPKPVKPKVISPYIDR